jgi:tetratricopeptide (TPR) repeat protein
MIETTYVRDLDRLWNPVDAAGSEAALLALLPEAQALVGPDRSYLIELLVQLARSQTAQKKILDARLNLNAAEKLLNEAGAIFTVAIKIKWLQESGRLFILEKTPSQARLVFVEALTLAENSGEDHHAVELAQLMAVIEPQKTQQDWIVKAIQLAERSPQQKAKNCLGSLYASLGWKLYDLHQYEKSLEIFQKSLSHLKMHGTQREVFVAQWSAGKVLRVMGRVEAALLVQKSLLSELGIGGAQDGRLYEELAECLQSLNRSDEAQLYFELAYRELSNDEWVNDNQPVKLKRMKDLGKVKNPAREKS